MRVARSRLSLPVRYHILHYLYSQQYADTALVSRNSVEATEMRNIPRFIRRLRLSRPLLTLSPANPLRQSQSLVVSRNPWTSKRNSRSFHFYKSPNHSRMTALRAAQPSHFFWVPAMKRLSLDLLNCLRLLTPTFWRKSARKLEWRSSPSGTLAFIPSNLCPMGSRVMLLRSGVMSRKNLVSLVLLSTRLSRSLRPVVLVLIGNLSLSVSNPSLAECVGRWVFCLEPRSSEVSPSVLCYFCNGD